MDRRDSSRTPARLDALVSCGGEEGAGALADISHSGAQIDESSLRPPVDAPVRLYVFGPGSRPFEIEGVVSRHTETGFALRYELHDALQRRQVDALVAQLTLAAAS